MTGSDKCNFKLYFFTAAWTQGSWKAGLGAAILNCTGNSLTAMGNSLSVETLRVGELWDRRSLGFWQLLRAQLPESLDFYVKEKKNSIIFKPLLAWSLSQIVSFTFLLIQRVTETDEWKWSMPKWPKHAVSTLFHISISLLLFRKVTRASINGVSCVEVQFSRKHTQTHTHTYTHTNESTSGDVGSSPSSSYLLYDLRKVTYSLSLTFPPLQNGANPFFNIGLTGLLWSIEMMSVEVLGTL